MTRIEDMKIKVILISMITITIALTGCSTKFTTIESDNGTILYTIGENEAFNIAYHSMLSVLPGRKITIIDGPTKGYSTYFRFLFDTYSQQILVIPASGLNGNGNKVSGYYYEVSGSGSSFVQGKAKNVALYETLNTNLRETNSGVIVTGLTKENYKTASVDILNGNTEVFDKIERLKKLYDKGAITEEEYKTKKTELLKNI